MRKILRLLPVVAVSILAGALAEKCSTEILTGTNALHLNGTAPRGFVADTVTVTCVDTIPYYLPAPKQEVQLGTQIKFLPVFIAKDNLINIPDSGNNAVQNIPDIISSPSVGHLTGPDSVAVEIPITQREYEGEEYHAWVSGYDPKLDSIFVFPRREVVTIKEPPKRQKRWGIGVFAGYGMTPHGFQPCAGVSINYNLWNFLVKPSE